MNKSVKILAALLVVASASIGVDAAFGQELNPVASDTLDIIEFVAVGSTIGGALVSVAQGIADSPANTPISKKKIFSAIITAITGSMTVINLANLGEQTMGMSLLAIVIMFGLLGYGADKGLARLDKDKK